MVCASREHMHRSDNFINAFKFTACQEWVDEDGIWNPRDGNGSFKGGLQINVYGNKERFLALSKYFAEMAAVADDHDHCELVSDDGYTRLHFIIRTFPDGQ
jgi:hypothetical protein